MANREVVFKGIDFNSIQDSPLKGQSFAYPPSLRKAAEQSVEALGQELNQLSLPRIVAVEHVDEMIPAIKKLIRSCPAKSKIGFEVSLPADSAPEIQRHLGKNNFFPELARYAVSQGHSAHWLESRLTRFTERERVTLRHLEKNFEERAGTPKDSARFSELILERMSLYKILEGGVPLTSEWRSRAMARYILRISDWRPTDLIIAGSAHAVNIAGLLRKSVDIVVGNYRDSADAKHEIDEVMAGQRSLSARLETARQLQRRINKFMGPFRKLAEL